MNSFKQLLQIFGAVRPQAQANPKEADHYRVEYDTLKKAVRYVSRGSAPAPGPDPVSLQWRDMGALIAKTQTPCKGDMDAFQTLSKTMHGIGGEIQKQSGADDIWLPRELLWSLYVHSNFLSEARTYYSNKAPVPFVEKGNVTYLMPITKSARSAFERAWHKADSEPDKSLPPEISRIIHLRTVPLIKDEKITSLIPTDAPKWEANYKTRQEAATDPANYVYDGLTAVSHFYRVVREFLQENPVIAADYGQRQIRAARQTYLDDPRVTGL